jgi:predicted acetyltransferase
LIRGPASTGRAWEVAEFYVVPESRREGVGCAALASIWRRFPGDWELQVHSRNSDAVRFWLSCVKRWVNPIPKSGKSKQRMDVDYNFALALTEPPAG